MKQFCQTGGLTHLFDSLINLPTATLHNSLTRKCFSILIKIIYVIQKSGFLLKENVRDYEANRNKMVERILVVLNAFSQYSIPKEGSITEENALTSKEQTKERLTSQARNDKELEIESQVFIYGFDLIRNEESNYLEPLINFPVFKEFLMNGLVLSGNPHIKGALKDEILRLFGPFDGKEFFQSQVYSALLPYMMHTMISETLEKDINCSCFYQLLCQLIKNLPKTWETEKLSIDFKEEVKNLATYIKEHKIKEKKGTDTDHLLIGLTKLLRELVVKFPDLKSYVVNDCGMIDEILQKCLFDFPNSETPTKLLVSIPPKCKSQDSRHAALNLLLTLCRNSPTNISKVIAYLTPIHTKGSWRTKRHSDWCVIPESDEKSITGYVGLKNLGAICYMNSLLQQFYMIPSFRYEILSVVDPEENANPDDNLLFQTQCLFSALSKSVKQYCNPKVFCHALKDWDNHPINVLEQMDVDEFFNLFLDRLEGALKKTLQKDTIKRHFGGMFANQIIGKDCPHASTRAEPFLALNLQVKGKRSLQQCLESFVEGEMLQGSNAYFCDKCDKKVTALKRTCIKRLPRHLICVLKRFDINYDTMQKFKINDYCEFPMKINMENFTAEGLEKKDREKELEKAKKEGRDMDEAVLKNRKEKTYPSDYYEYKLRGVVIHIGTSEMGHYYSLIMDREHDDISENERWYEFNDTQVEKYNLENIKDDAFGNDGKTYGARYLSKLTNAYLLFYERASSYEPPEEDEEEIADKPTSSKTPTLSAVIPKEINNEIQAENVKYWYNRYLFQANNFEFVYKLGLFWNSQEIVTEKYSTRDQDYHLLDIKEVGRRKEQKDGKMDEGKLLDELKDMTSDELNGISIKVAKFVLTVLLTTLLHCRKSATLPNFLEMSKAYLNKHPELSKWLITQFSNSEIIKEFLLECPSKDIIKFVAGLLYCAMLNVYELEKAVIVEGDPTKSTIVNFAYCWFNQLPKYNKTSILSESFPQLISRIVFLGPEIREVLLKQDCLKHLLNLFNFDNEPMKELLKAKSVSELKWVECKDIEIGFSSVVNDKFPNPYKELFAAHLAKLNEFEVNYDFIIDAISLLLRSTAVNDKTKDSPFAMKGCQTRLDENIKLLLCQPKIISMLIGSCRMNLASISCIQALVHISWEDMELKMAVAKGILLEVPHMNSEKMHDFFYIFNMLVKYKDSLQANIIDFIQIQLLQIMKQFTSNYSMISFINLLLALAESVPLVHEWYRNNVEKWSWISKWLKDRLQPPGPGMEYAYSFTRMEEHNYKLFGHNPLEENIRRFTICFENLEKGEKFGRSEHLTEIKTMYYKKFMKGQKVLYFGGKPRCWQKWIVINALDEMIHIRPLDSDEKNAEWVEIGNNLLSEVIDHSDNKVSKDEVESDQVDSYVNEI